MRSALGVSLLVLGIGFTGGCDPVGPGTEEDPKPGTWDVGTNTVQADASNSSVVMLDSKLVLVTGGHRPLVPKVDWTTKTSALYDPQAKTWKLTGDLKTPRHLASAVKLPSGKVLLSGGVSLYSILLQSVELYEPDNDKDDKETGTWKPTESMLQPRYGHRSTLLHSGKVLVTGGYTLTKDSSGKKNGETVVATTAELYDPATGHWSSAGDLKHSTNGATSTLLDSGEVLLLGLSGVDIYNPDANTWSQEESPPFVARSGHTATSLASGKILIAGGSRIGTSSDSTALYDPSTHTWVEGPPMNQPNWGHTATLLSSRKVLVLGGSGGTELYDPEAKVDEDSTTPWPWTPLATPPRTHIMATAVVLPNDQVLLTGGTAENSSVAIFTLPPH